MSHINPLIRGKTHSKDPGIKPLDYYVNGMTRNHDLYILSEAITLLESDLPAHRDLANDLLAICYEHKSSSFRLGITGTPGVGKSTFIDSVVDRLISKGESIGILTIDPSSVDGRGSILGDKTRMEKLAKEKNVFIRPSPSKLHLGGIHQYTFEAIVMCEATGMDNIFIETVGIGQSEVDVGGITDATIVLVLPGSGDSLQGIKKGILEMADLVVVHKADGDRIELANQSIRELGKGLHYSKGTSQTPIIAYSSLTGQNNEQLHNAINRLKAHKLSEVAESRKSQENQWLQTRLSEYIHRNIEEQIKKSGILQDHHQLSGASSPFQRFKEVKNKIKVRLTIDQ